jgi:hypothetical protein
MHRNVETVLGRLATDPKRLERFAADPAAALRALLDEGIELNDVELAALARTDFEALQRFAASLDPRIRKAPLAADRRSESATTSNHAATGKE